VLVLCISMGIPSTSPPDLLQDAQQVQYLTSSMDSMSMVYLTSSMDSMSMVYLRMVSSC
jgi:hypothetical protein